MSQVYCYRCRRTHEVPLSNLVFSVFHLPPLHILRCPHCGRYSWHRHIIGEGKSESAGEPFDPQPHKGGA